MGADTWWWRSWVPSVVPIGLPGASEFETTGLSRVSGSELIGLSRESGSELIGLSMVFGSEPSGLSIISGFELTDLPRASWSASECWPSKLAWALSDSTQGAGVLLTDPVWTASTYAVHPAGMTAASDLGETMKTDRGKATAVFVTEFVRTVWFSVSDLTETPVTDPVEE